MFESLYKFLITHRHICLPGIGTVILQTRPAQSEFVNRSFSPPTFFFTLEDGKESSSEKLISWLASNEHVSEREAAHQFNEFVADLNRQLEAGKDITWSGVGVFRNDSTEKIKLEPAKKEFPFLEQIIAQKVIRENAEHTVLVGEAEKTSTQMTEILSGDTSIREKQSRWWLWPLAAIIVILIFLGWYFSEHGMSSASTGNNHRISVSSP